MGNHTVIFTPSGQKAAAEDGESVYDVALKSGVDMQSICGGKGLCHRCQVEIEPGTHAKFQITVGADNVGKLSPTEKKAIHDGELPDHRRLACRAKIKGDLVVEVPSDSREFQTFISKKSQHIDEVLNPSTRLHMVQLPVPSLEDNPSDTEALIGAIKSEHGLEATASHRVFTKIQGILAGHDRTVIAVVRDGNRVIDVWPPAPFDVYGAAIDVGSTSIAMYVYNLSTAELVYETSAMNPQIRYGEDLMSRVSYVMMNKGGEHRLTEEIRRQLAKMLNEAAAKLDIGPNQLLEIMIVGNPIMHHLVLGISPVELGQAPFTLAVKDWVEIRGRDIKFDISDYARLSFFPLIGGHVGADTAAAYLTQMDDMAGRSVLLVDIGTNAEIVLSHAGKVAAASSPTGPAFEGAEISSGVRAGPGAIERVRIDPVSKDPSFKIIGHEDWLEDNWNDNSVHRITGICGSGIFEVMVELASAGLLDKSGLFIPEAAPHRFVQSGEKSWKYLLLDRPENPIYVKQTDVRAVQLAKAALFAGAELLAEHLGCSEFDEVLLAGAFGNHLDSKYVADIGIVPFASHDKIRSIGNAAGTGAAMAILNKNNKDKIIKAVAEIEKVETATEPKFQDYFVGAMKFPTGAEPREDNTKRRRRRRA